MTNDASLLREYVRNASEAAFSELVSRHIDLVYGTALKRLGGNSERAKDVTQKVFIDLVRKAPTLVDRSTLAGWLYLATRNASAELMRSEDRRQQREREAQLMQEANAGAEIDWDAIKPLLDQAMRDLKDQDRDVLLLRFYEARDFGEIAESIQVKEFAARRRCERALERLRVKLARAGITSTAAALSTALTGEAVAASPAGLVHIVTGAALTQGIGTSIAASTVFNIMTTTKIVLGVTALAIGFGGALWLHNTDGSQIRRQNEELQRAHEDLATASAENRRLASQLASARQAQADAAAKAKHASGAMTDAAASAMDAWLGRTARLRQRFEDMPEQKIPELQYATEEDWLEAGRDPLESEKDWKRAMARVRTTAVFHFSALTQTALNKFLHDHGDVFPATLDEIAPYYGSPVDGAILQRYKVAPASAVPNMVMGGDFIITAAVPPIDPKNDTLVVVSPRGMGSTGYSDALSAAILNPVLLAYRAANNNRLPASPEDLLPYAQTEEQKAQVAKRIAASKQQ